MHYREYQIATHYRE